jgi:hypothetical protein
VAWNQTSVNSFWGEKPYNLLKDKEHWDLFEDPIKKQKKTKAWDTDINTNSS